MIKCPSCKNNGIPTGIIFKKNHTASSSKTNFNFNIKYCDKCNNYFNSAFIQSKIDYKQTVISTYFSHQENKDELSKSINKINELFFKIKLNILEFGCGDGEFLSMVKRSKKLKIINHLCYDTDISRIKKGLKSSNDLNDFINNFSKNNLNFVICRHVIEHLEDVSFFFKNIPQDQDIALMVEVPNGYNALENLNRFEDLIYEHVSYLSNSSLYKLLDFHNFKILDSFNYLNEENIVFFAYRGGNKNLENLKKNKLLAFNTKYNSNKKKYQKLAKYLHNPKVCFWGISGRCFTILNNAFKLNKNNSLFKCFLADSDKSKSNTKIPGFLKLCQNPNQLDLNKIDLILIGTKVGASSIMKELKQLKFKKKVCIWDDIK